MNIITPPHKNTPNDKQINIQHYIHTNISTQNIMICFLVGDLNTQRQLNELSPVSSKFMQSNNKTKKILNNEKSHENL